MNYWKQFAEMLGLELGQEFTITDLDGNRDEEVYKITETGIKYKRTTSTVWCVEPPETIEWLLSGGSKAVPKPWKPRNGDAYWWYAVTQPIAYKDTWWGNTNCLCRWKCGNCFKTQEEAETKGKEIIEQIKKEYEEN